MNGQMLEDKHSAEVAEAREIVKRLTAEIVKQYNSGPPGPARKPGATTDDAMRDHIDYMYMVGRKGNALEGASASLHRLRMYDRLLLQQPDIQGVDDVISVADIFMRCCDENEMRLVSDKHIERLRRVNVELSRHDEKSHPDLRLMTNRAYLNVMRAAAVVSDEPVSHYVIQNIAAVGHLVVERRITEHYVLIDHIEGMEHGAAPLMEGTL